MAKHYLSERTELYEQLKTERQLTKEEEDCLEWLLDHISNKYLGALLTMINEPRKHNERGAGRKAKDLPVTAEMIRMRNDSGESMKEIAKSYGMSKSTLYKLLKGTEND